MELLNHMMKLYLIYRKLSNYFPRSLYYFCVPSNNFWKFQLVYILRSNWYCHFLNFCLLNLSHSNRLVASYCAVCSLISFSRWCYDCIVCVENRSTFKHWVHLIEKRRKRRRWRTRRLFPGKFGRCIFSLTLGYKAGNGDNCSSMMNVEMTLVIWPQFIKLPK